MNSSWEVIKCPNLHQVTVGYQGHTSITTAAVKCQIVIIVLSIPIGILLYMASNTLVASAFLPFACHWLCTSAWTLCMSLTMYINIFTLCMPLTMYINIMPLCMSLTMYISIFTLCMSLAIYRHFHPLHVIGYIQTFSLFACHWLYTDIFTLCMSMTI